MLQYDAIVVGAGPGGAACARALVEERRRVLVVERYGLPRHKTCSGVLFGQSLVLLERYFGGLPPERLCCQPSVIRSTNILRWRKTAGPSTYTWELPKGDEPWPTEYHNVWRNHFDYWLLRRSEAEHLDRCRFVRYALGDDGVRVFISRDGQAEQALRCAYLVGADGASSVVRSFIDPDWVTKSRVCVARYDYYRFADLGDLLDDHWYVFLEPELGDIIACVHRKDETLALSVGGFKGRNLKECLANFLFFLTDELHVEFGQRDRSEACTLRLADPLLGQGRVLLVGDAAGLMYLNAEGISAALDSGFRAGKAIAQALDRGRPALDEYAKDARDIIEHVSRCRQHYEFFVPPGD